MCLVPAAAKSGDLICLLKGGAVPLMLRQLTGFQWTLVGQYYVHGIMYGEAFQESEYVDMQLV